MRINTGMKGSMAVVMWLWLGVGIISQLTRSGAYVEAIDVTSIIPHGGTTMDTEEPVNGDPVTTWLPVFITTSHLTTTFTTLDTSSEPATHDSSTEPATLDSSTGPSTLEPSTESNTLGPSTGSNTLGPSTGSNTLGPSTGSTTLGPSTGSTTMGPSTESGTLGSSTGSTTMGPSTESTTLGPSTRFTTTNPLAESTTISSTPSDGLLETETAIYDNVTNVATKPSTSAEGHEGYYTPKIFLIIMMCSVCLVILAFTIMGGFYIRGRVKASKQSTAPVLRRHRAHSRRGVAIDNPMFRENGHEIHIHGPGAYLETDITLAAGLESFGYNTKIGRDDSWSADRRSRDSRTKTDASMCQIEEEEQSKPRTDSCLTEELGREGGVENQIKGVLVLDGITDSDTVVSSSSRPTTVSTVT